MYKDKKGQKKSTHKLTFPSLRGALGTGGWNLFAPAVVSPKGIAQNPYQSRPLKKHILHPKGKPRNHINPDPLKKS